MTTSLHPPQIRFDERVPEPPEPDFSIPSDLEEEFDIPKKLLRSASDVTKRAKPTLLEALLRSCPRTTLISVTLNPSRNKELHIQDCSSSIPALFYRMDTTYVTPGKAVTAQWHSDVAYMLFRAGLVSDALEQLQAGWKSHEVVPCLQRLDMVQALADYLVVLRGVTEGNQMYLE
ncbi:hypothetical protein B0T24DRAFT_589399 [Lasiosphaeria ovina]|uniref:Uncharacterized protein n=1 Tax=Lasiosphaeria ovina TaxID=92902 RepID=A0AAE0KL63_9PEZI|nr:hypothetical protein B0T24DRAFT_589399 [Lasiosphaeria ovina]